MVLDMARGSFRYQMVVGLVKYVIIFDGDMSSSVHIDHKMKDVLILGKGYANCLDNTTLTG